MPSRREKVTSRLFQFDPWNHKLRVAVLFPVFFLLGYAAGILAVSPLVPVSPYVVGAIGGGFAVLVGSVPLALVD